MILTFIILSVVSVITGVVLLNKMTEHLPEPPAETEEPGELDPPALPTFPDPVDWESLSCEEIEKKLQEIQEYLMVVKIPQELYEFWVDQIEHGQKLFAARCITTDLPL